MLRSDMLHRVQEIDKSIKTNNWITTLVVGINAHRLAGKIIHTCRKVGYESLRSVYSDHSLHRL